MNATAARNLARTIVNSPVGTWTNCVYKGVDIAALRADKRRIILARKNSSTSWLIRNPYSYIWNGLRYTDNTPLGEGTASNVVVAVLDDIAAS